MDDLVQRLRDAINEKYPIRGHATGELLRDALAALSAPARVTPPQHGWRTAMTDNLPGLVKRLREARPDLIARTPWWCEGKAHFGHPWYCIDDDAARVIVIGACAEALARSGWGMAYDNDVWAARANVSPVKIGIMPQSPDFLTAIVSAVIALAEEDRHG